MFDFFPEEIDFLDEDQIEPLRDKMEDELLHIMSDKKYTIAALEEVLFMAQSWAMPVIEQILDLKALSRFSELKEAYKYVLENWKKHEKRPYPKVEEYFDMCYDTGPIVGEDDEEAGLTEEEVEILREEYFAEIERKKPDSEVITLCDYHALEIYYYFLDYFMEDECANNRDELINYCVERILDTLFNVVWYIDYAHSPGVKTKDSGFMNAVKEICDIDSKFRSEKTGN